MKYSLVKYNKGPFVMFQVMNNHKKSPQAMKTFSDEEEANNYIQRCVEDDQWNASNRD